MKNEQKTAGIEFPKPEFPTPKLPNYGYGMDEKETNYTKRKKVKK